MSDIVTGVRQLIQDLIAPDLKALSVKQDAIIMLHLDVISKNMDAFRAEMRSELLALRSSN